MFSDVWSENAALIKRLMKVHSYQPILYFGFKKKMLHIIKQTSILNY